MPKRGDGSLPLRSKSLDRSHFERLYDARPDPWRYATSAYEAAKYQATLAALPRPRYARALDVGCSIGVLTGLLAPRCADLLAIEAAEAALEQARRRNAAVSHVRFACSLVPADWPAGRFDLVVISEVLDYLDAADLSGLAARLAGSLEVGADLVLVHWVGKKGPVSNGEESTDRLAQALGGAVVPLQAERNRDYRLDVFRRR